MLASTSLDEKILKPFEEINAWMHKKLKLFSFSINKKELDLSIPSSTSLPMIEKKNGLFNKIIFDHNFNVPTMILIEVIKLIIDKDGTFHLL